LWGRHKNNANALGFKIMKLPFDPDCKPLFNTPPYKPIDLHPKRLKKYLDNPEDIKNCKDISRYKYDYLNDRMELIE
jgi:hypothetical protein